jgi:hypothetical protein
MHCTVFDDKPYSTFAGTPPGIVLFELGHLPLHELAEQGYGEGRFTMPPTPNHALAGWETSDRVRILKGEGFTPYIKVMESGVSSP